MEPKVEIVTVFGQCKCCLEYGYLKHMWSEHEWRGEQEIYGEMLKATFGVDWEIEKDSEYICEPCITRVREAYNFKKRMLTAEEKAEQEETEENDRVSNVKVEKIEVEYDYCEVHENSLSKELDEDLKQDSPQKEDPEDAVSVTEDHKLDSADEGSDQEPVSADDDEDYVANEDTDDEEMMDEEAQEFEEIEYLEEDAEFVEKACKTKLNETSDSKFNEASNSNTGTERQLWVKRKKGAVKQYKNYSQMNMKRCIEAVMSNNLPQSQAAKIYNIPKKTLKSTISNLRKKKRDDGIQSEEQFMTKKEERMKHKDNVTTVLVYTNATPFKGHWTIGYTCQFCPGHFKKPADLKNHTESHKNIPKRYTEQSRYSYIDKLDMTGLICKICNHDIDKLTLEQVFEHLIKHGKVIHLNIKNHIVPFKFDSDKLRCAICDLKFDYFKLLNLHMNEHYSNYVCTVCNRGFVNPNSLRLHSKIHDAGVYDCSYCNKQFGTKKRQMSHERAVHILKNKTHTCSYCDEKFIDMVQKTRHEVKKHGIEPKKFTCELCKKLFNSQRSLTAHVKSFHLQLRPHKCSVCKKGYFKRSSLRLHMVTHTDAKNFQCDICKKRFARKTTLKSHLKYHAAIQKNYSLYEKANDVV